MPFTVNFHPFFITKTIKYNGQEFQSLKGMGYKTNYFDIETGEEYWISGPKKNGEDALYPLDIEMGAIQKSYFNNVLMAIPQ